MGEFPHFIQLRSLFRGILWITPHVTTYYLQTVSLLWRRSLTLGVIIASLKLIILVITHAPQGQMVSMEKMMFFPNSCSMHGVRIRLVNRFVHLVLDRGAKIDIYHKIIHCGQTH